MPHTPPWVQSGPTPALTHFRATPGNVFRDQHAVSQMCMYYTPPLSPTLIQPWEQSKEYNRVPGQPFLGPPGTCPLGQVSDLVALPPRWVGERCH